MIELIFRFGNEVILIKIQGNNILFGNTTYGSQMASIGGLKLNRVGVEKEFPYLKNNEKWREVAIERFKEKIRSFPTEKMKAEYIVDDLKKYGYEFKKMQVAGRRSSGKLY